MVGDSDGDLLRRGGRLPLRLGGMEPARRQPRAGRRRSRPAGRVARPVRLTAPPPRVSPRPRCSRTDYVSGRIRLGRLGLGRARPPGHQPRSTRPQRRAPRLLSRGSSLGRLGLRGRNLGRLGLASGAATSIDSASAAGAASSPGPQPRSARPPGTQPRSTRTQRQGRRPRSRRSAPPGPQRQPGIRTPGPHLGRGGLPRSVRSRVLAPLVPTLARGLGATRPTATLGGRGLGGIDAEQRRNLGQAVSHPSNRFQQLVGRLLRNRRRLHLQSNRGIGQGVHRGRPQLLVGAHGQTARHGADQRRRQISRNRGARLRGPRAETQPRTNRPASRLTLMSSTQMTCSSSTRRFRPSCSCCFSARVSSSRVTLSAATTTERRSRRSSSSRSASAAWARSFHSRGPKRREHRLGQCDHLVDGNLGTVLGDGLGVLLGHSLTYRGHTTAKNLLRDRTHLGGDVLQDRTAIGAARPEALGLRSFGHGTGSGSRGPIAPIAPLRPTASIAPTGAVATVPAVAAVTSAAAPTPVASVAVAAPLADQLRRHPGFAATRSDDLQQLGLLANGLGSQNAHDVDAVDEELRIGAQNVTDLRSGGQKASVHLSLGLLGSGGAPGPTSVGALAGQLDLETT